MIDAGRAAVTRFTRAGLSMPSLAAVFVTHLHADHTVDLFSFPLLSETEGGVVVFSGDTARTPNIPRLAAGADILVHEAYHREAVAAIGYPPAVVEHIGAVHTEVGDLGAVGAEAEARGVAISHISPADPNVLSDAAWQRAADQSARKARYGGRITLGNDLDRFPLAKPGKGK
ncbi:Ribonuclease BN [Actinomadura sp. RB99]|nr:hypothetical protein [Actinomadura sp. RB99]MBD2896578.1 Ribonuclease BN [Actinomadura sp. RB99]